MMHSCTLCLLHRGAQDWGSELMAAMNVTGRNFSLGSEVVPVGAADITSFSSYGPASDGRVKPDLVAPGSVILSSYPQEIVGE